MDNLFLSLLVILAGGVSALLLYRQFTFMKLVVITTTSIGCAIGLASALPRLLNPTAVKDLSWTWLHLFTLSFKIDSVSLFFLIPILIITPLALIYSFHYMENKKRLAGPQ